MKSSMIKCLMLLIALPATILPAVLDAGSAVFDIPRINGITVDGSGDDWAANGFRVEFLTDQDGRTIPADDFDVKFRLGWNTQGLLVLAAVRDDMPVEHQNLSRLWQRDCVEIFVSEKKGSTNRYQLVIASGADPKYKIVRNKLYDWRPENKRDSKLTAQAASQVYEGGYVVETLLPWANLGIEPAPGMELAFQLVANDDDGGAEETDGSLRVAWFPGLGPRDPNNYYPVRLSDKPSEAVLFRIDRKISLGRCTISVRGSSELIGEPVVVRSADEIIAKGKLGLQDGRAGIEFALPKLEDRDAWPQVEVAIGGKPEAMFEALSSLDWVLERYLQAVGGRAAIKKLTTRMCTGQLIHEFPSRQPPTKEVIPFKAYAKIPDRWVTILQVSGGTEQNGFDGKVGWRQNTDRIERDDSQERPKLAWLLNPQGALHMQDYFPGMVLKTREMQEGRAVYVVEPTSLNKAHYMLYFDVETGMPVQIGYYWKLQDYREVDSVKFPFRIVLSRKGGSSTFAFDDVKHNVPVEDKRFAMPDAGEVFADAFQGIEDSKVLPMLKMKDLTYEHGEMNIPCRDGRFLYDFIIKNNYKRGLEIGTYNGYSTLWLGLALKKTGGEVITVEIDPVSGQEARQNFRKAGLEDVIDSRINDAFDEIPKIKGEFDFIFIDARKEDYGKFLRLLKDRIKPGGAFVAHNVTNYARDMQEFLDAIKKDPDLETTFHEISAEGFSVSIKRK